MWFGLLTLITALIISVSAAYYSILGLTAIFAAAFWPIVILGSSLEVGKIVSTLWLHKYWERAELQYKVYLSTAVAILMVLTSMGVFGFLSKAHSDQDLVSGDVIAKISIYDEKIKQSRDNIDMARRALTQMDAAVDQTMSRSSTEQGADKAAQLRRSQATERNRLLKEIDTEQKKIQTISEERAPIAAEVRKVEAEVGPIKYIAALIYGDNPDTNLLEKSVRWVIILIVIVFDPLALTLLLAATKSIEWERGINVLATRRKEPEYEPDDGALTDDQIDQLRKMAQADLPIGKVVATETLFSENNDYADESTVTTPNKSRVLTGLASMWNRSKNNPIKDPEAEHAPLETPIGVVDPKDNTGTDINEYQDILSTESAVLNALEDDKNDEDGTTPAEKEAQRAWKVAHPNDTIKKYRQLYEAGFINELPWNHPDYTQHAQLSTPPPSGDGNLWIPQDGKWTNAGPIDQINLSDLGLSADNVPAGATGELKGFGTSFPATPTKGDMFLRVDQLPTGLYKFNGNIWIEVDKSLSDQHAYDAAYIDHLIEKISTGEYDPDLLSNAERDSIERRLNNQA
jgi:hypothetical protein